MTSRRGRGYHHWDAGQPEARGRGPCKQTWMTPGQSMCHSPGLPTKLLQSQADSRQEPSVHILAGAGPLQLGLDTLPLQCCPWALT